MIRLYIVDLAEYNSGNLHGKWIDIEGLTKEEMKEEADKVLKPGHEEWAVHDSEDIPDHFGEHPDLGELENYVNACSDWDSEIVSAYINNMGDVPDDLEDKISDCYAGTHRNLEEWAEQLMEDTGGLNEVPENLRYYFDFEKYGRDCELNGDIWTTETSDGLAVFWNQ